MTVAQPQTQTCPQCGWALDLESLRQNTCRKCRSAVLVASMASLERLEPTAVHKYVAHYAEHLKRDPRNRDALGALAICYLRLGLHPLAQTFARHLVDAHPADASGYMLAALSKLAGRRPSSASLPVIREADALLSTAIALDPASGRYGVLLAAIRRDYYVANGLRAPSPPPDELLEAALAKPLDRVEVAQLLACIGLDPEETL